MHRIADFVFGMKLLLFYSLLTCILCSGCKQKASPEVAPIIGYWEVDVPAMQAMLGGKPINAGATDALKAMFLEIEPHQVVQYNLNVGAPSVPKMSVRREGDLIICTSDVAKKELLQIPKACFQVADANTMVQMGGPDFSKPSIPFKRLSKSVFQERLKANGAKLYSEAQMRKLMESAPAGQ